jgi:hypothetical protein
MAEFSLLSGNVAAVLYAMVLLALLFALRSDRWSPFYIAVVVSALIKPPMLAFLLFPLLRGYILPSVVSTFAVTLGFLAQRLFMPALYHRFSQAVYTSLFSPAIWDSASLQSFQASCVQRRQFSLQRA